MTTFQYRPAAAAARISIVAAVALGLPSILARGEEQTSAAAPLSDRLQPQHLQAAHDARLRFQKERRRLPSHGVFEDIPAIIAVQAQGAATLKEVQPQILAAARKANIKVVLTAERGGPAPDAWRGLHGGLMVIAGGETDGGVLWFPANGQGTGNELRFLNNRGEHDDKPEQTTGLSVIHRYSGPGLEKVTREYLAGEAAVPAKWETLLESFHSYPDEFFAATTEVDPKPFARWDQETQTRHFTGIGLNDSHPKLNYNGVLLDPNELNYRNTVTHILAEDLSEKAIREALAAGRVYVAHDWICDPSGFMFGAINNLGVFGMGDTAPMQGRTRVTAMSPLPAKFRLFHNGEMIQEIAGTNLNFEAKEAGAYRLEAWLTLGGEERPWIYSNPIYLRKTGPGDLQLPSMAISAEVERHKDLTYTDGAEEDAGKHKLDIYTPKNKSSAPVLFFIHGGSWKSGDRSNYPAFGNRYALAGLVTVVPSYRLAPKNPHPAQIEDVAAAFAWTVSHVAEYGGDTNRIYVAGHSAGGHLAALLSLDEHYLAAHKVSPRMIHGVLALSGVYNLTNGESQDSVFGHDPLKRRDASPLYHVKSGAPPFLITYCQWDYFSLPAQAREFDRALEKAGVKTHLVYIPREDHISEILTTSKESNPIVAAALSFMK